PRGQAKRLSAGRPKMETAQHQGTQQSAMRLRTLRPMKHEEPLATESISFGPDWEAAHADRADRAAATHDRAVRGGAAQRERINLPGPRRSAPQASPRPAERLEPTGRPRCGRGFPTARARRPSDWP